MSAGSKSSKLGGGVPPMDRPIIMKRSIGGTLISPAERWKVCVMGNHLFVSAISKALLAGTTGRVKKWPNPRALTIPCTIGHIRPYNRKTPDHELWRCTLSLAYKKNKSKYVRVMLGSKMNKNQLKKARKHQIPKTGSQA